ncbi:MAG: ABC transporter permease [Firmicutes bacterium]|nr:ABC transporter permease [Bacillota bacterium]
MSNVLKLFKGEITRLIKYKIIFFSLLVSAIWVLFIALVSKAEAISFIPFLIIMDDALMSIVFLATSFFYEKQEGIAKTLLVAPVSVTQILISKVAASLFTGVLSLVIIALSSLIFHGIIINWALALLYMFLAVFAHTAIGYIIILASKDFMGFMVKFMGIILALLIPTVLIALDIIPAGYTFIVILSPTYAAQLLVDSLFHTVDGWQIVLACVYLFGIGALIFPLFVHKKYQRFAMEG